MTAFSVPTSYSITSSDTITIDTATMANISAASSGLSNITITNGTGSSYYYNTPATMTINSSGNIGIGATTIGAINPSTFKWKNEEFVDTLPDITRIQKMCDQYPGLKIAFEKFKTTYYLVKDHYDTPEDQRPIP
jgi:hypothetical protein